MPARDLEEPRHVGDIFAALAAFPGKPAIQPELAALAYGAHRANVSKISSFPIDPASVTRATLTADGLLAKIDAETPPMTPRAPPTPHR